MNTEDKFDKLIDTVHALDKKVEVIIVNQQRQELQLIAVNENTKENDHRLKKLEDAQLVQVTQIGLINKILSHKGVQGAFFFLVMIVILFHQTIADVVNKKFFQGLGNG